MYNLIAKRIILYRLIRDLRVCSTFEIPFLSHFTLPNTELSIRTANAVKCNIMLHATVQKVLSQSDANTIRSMI